jgi:hypothetical protein
MVPLRWGFGEIVGGVVDTSTAIIGSYSLDGFVVASDGLSVWPDSSPKNSNMRKIFEIVRPECVLVYAVMGNPLITEDATGAKVVNIPKTVGNNGMALSLDGIDTLREFARAACAPVIEILTEALVSGKICDYPRGGVISSEPGESIARILFMGYFKKSPFMVAVNIFHIDQALQPISVRSDSLRRGYHFGCPRVATLVDGGDAYFKKYAAPYPLTTEGRVKEAKGYIDAYGDAKARNPDLNCRGIGGETQVWIVRPEGIEWVYGPAIGGVE